MNQEIVYADRTALIVIDMQYEFVHQNGAIYVKQAEEQIPLISDLINYCRTKGIFIIYTKDTKSGFLKESLSFFSIYGFFLFALS